MKILFSSFVLILLFGIVSYAEAKICHDSKDQKKCFVALDAIQPTQFALGMLAIEYKIQKIEDYYQKGKLQKYLTKKTAPTIIGPGNKLYIIDRHHTSYALCYSNIPSQEKKIRIEIIEDWSHLTFAEFAEKMINNNYAWLQDGQHQLRTFSELPSHITSLHDDPYRSLAWKVRKENGFKKVMVSYLEFIWGIFFKKQGIELKESSPEEIDNVLKQALELSRSPKASHLPGYITSINRR